MLAILRRPCVFPVSNSVFYSEEDRGLFEGVPETHIRTGKKESFQVTNKKSPSSAARIFSLLCQACELILSIVLNVPNS